MKTNRPDLIEQLEALDGFLEGKDDGVRPLDLLLARGLVLPESSAIDDETLSEKLQNLIQEMASMGIYLEFTDHLSDRELWDYLRNDALLTPEFLCPEDPLFACHLSPIGGYSNEDIAIDLRYYADEETRQRWAEDWPEDTMPPHESRPYDRDRFLPKHEERLRERRANR